MLPLMLSVVIAHFVNAFFTQETIYTKKLTRRGIMIQMDKRIPIFKSMLVSEILVSDMLFCSPSDNITEVLKKMHDKNLGLLPVLENGKVMGIISYAELYHFNGPDSEKIEELYNRKNIVVRPDMNLYTALDLMSTLKTAILVVKDEEKTLGFVTRNRIITSYLEKRSRL
jgi:CIC family chloride channel protein